MAKIADLVVNRQVCIIIDLAISRLDRHQRHAKLDKFLFEYFLEKNLTAKIIHQQGKKAQLLLTSNLTQPTMLNNPQGQAYDLHISYSLPLVAVSWTEQNGANSIGLDLDIGIDLAQASDFVMENAEWHTLQQLYFSLNLPLFQNPDNRCQAWTRLEAQHKCCRLALQEYSPQRDFFFSNLSVESQFFDFKGQNYCLSVAKK